MVGGTPPTYAVYTTFSEGICVTNQACDLYSSRMHETHFKGWWRIASIRSLAARAAKLGATGAIPDVLWAHEKPKSE